VAGTRTNGASVSPRYPVRQRPAIHRSSFREWRENGDRASIETRPFWRWFDTPAGVGEGVDAAQVLTPEEFRVLSKGASGGGFLVPTDLAESVHAAARAASPIAQLATEFLTARGDSFGVSLAGSHGSAAWIAESGSYTPSDETITNAALGAHKAGTKIIVSEELRQDEAVSMDDFLGAELGGRLGALQEAAFTVGDGSGKPLGVATSGNGISVVTAGTGSTTSYKLADIKAVFKAVPQAYRRTASWLIGGDDFAELAALADSAGALVLPSLQFDPPSLFGRPVFVSADLAVPAANARGLVFGDFALGYGVRRVLPIGLQRQDELHSDVGQTGWRMTSRVDGKPLLTDALRILAHSAT
jgi:HK97 family phage major capsid protein